ncbi:hypothetical protein predicted by Glimmer/Critica [Helicobacter pylori B8]|uniref:Uncharacterized protein n=1 Tax=Helicobacter pylori (strain B8) TaxID=693745 RepID=D7FFD0_HELP3|nr:hypothetical protein predicted by Glimmer/Critica [Helicobacter pylori B8]
MIVSHKAFLWGYEGLVLGLGRVISNTPLSPYEL